MKKWIIILVLGVSLSCSQCDKDNGTKSTEEEKGVSEITYHGWDNSVRISNGDATIIVVPAIGRIMHYSLKDGDNILWENSSFFGKTLSEGQPYTVNGSMEWANFGGDKVWPTEQSEFPTINGHGWPPDHWFDGGRHDYELLENGVRITSQVSDYCGARSIREITLAETGSEVTINQTIEKIKAAQKRSVELIDFTIWNVTQIRNPQVAIFNLNPASSLDGGFRAWSASAAANFTREGGVGYFTVDYNNSQKLGADSDKWLGAIVEDYAFGEFFDFQPGERYPDGGLSAEVYTSPQYTEIELLSPFKALRLNETLQFNIKWRLAQLESNTPQEMRTEAVDWLNSFE